MTSPVVTVSPEATLSDAARLMHQRGVKRLPVTFQASDR
jgi:CBS domain-containing protein